MSQYYAKIFPLYHRPLFSVQQLSQTKKKYMKKHKEKKVFRISNTERPLVTINSFVAFALATARRTELSATLNTARDNQFKKFLLVYILVFVTVHQFACMSTGRVGPSTSIAACTPTK